MNGIIDFFKNRKIEKKEITLKDIALLVALTLVYAFLVFFRIGSVNVPQTFSEFNTVYAEGKALAKDAIDNTSPYASDEIVLDLGEEKHIDQMLLYPGYMPFRLIAFSYFDEEKEEWIQIDEEVKVEGIYSWLPYDLDVDCRYLGIVTRSGRLILNEIVLLDDAGETILPVNTEQFPALFDEQDCFSNRTTYMENAIFDEVLYAGSAYEYMNGVRMFEDTHPPLGKILMAMGEKLFGVNPLGWRFASAVAGILILPVIFLLVYTLYENSFVALVCTALSSMEFMHYALARIATIDSLIAFFVLLSFTLFILVCKSAEEEFNQGKKKPGKKVFLLMIFNAFCLGLAVATKWTAFYCMAGMCLLFLIFVIYRIVKEEKQSKKISYIVWFGVSGLLCYSLIPLCVYVLSFLPETRIENNPNVFFVMLKESLYMLSFHEDAIFEHVFASPWYTWLLDLHPLIDSVFVTAEGKESVIATFGNPLIWWFGLPALLMMILMGIFQKDKKYLIPVYGYGMMLLPWIFIKRTVFIYQYFIPSQFLCCALGVCICSFDNKEKNRKISLYVLEAVLLVFILFFPMISGFPMWKDYYTRFLFWLKSWDVFELMERVATFSSR